ncbi:MAG: hypothetical protein KGL68_10570 [Burkholderiales bacterium]|nr:hypothetical protein [Burkholderiales bacterium]
MKPALKRMAAMLVATLSVAASLAQPVKPPPLPAGSELARPQPGMNEPERKRMHRAHKQPHPRDYRVDDSVQPPPPATPGSRNPNAGR